MLPHLNTFLPETLYHPSHSSSSPIFSYPHLLSCHPFSFYWRPHLPTRFLPTFFLHYFPSCRPPSSCVTVFLFPPPPLPFSYLPPTFTISEPQPQTQRHHKFYLSLSCHTQYIDSHLCHHKLSEITLLCHHKYVLPVIRYAIQSSPKAIYGTYNSNTNGTLFGMCCSGQLLPKGHLHY